MREHKTIWTKKFILFLIMVAFYFLNNYMLNPILVGYANSMGGAGTIVGLISGAMSGVALFLTPVAGPFADRFNPKNSDVDQFFAVADRQCDFFSGADDADTVGGENYSGDRFCVCFRGFGHSGFHHVSQ